MIKQIIIPIVLLIATIAVQQASAFPCSGGSGKEYCRAFHSGALQADKDSSNPAGTGEIFHSSCPSGHTADYCDGWTRGYDKESQIVG